jgi:hypothetical protein
MKKLIIKPGFEFIFTLSLMAVLGLPPLVFGQSNKDEQITIVNGDTTINGKNIKELSGKERQDALKDISQIATIKSAPGQPSVIANNGPRRKTTVMKYHFKYNFKDSSAGKINRDEWRSKRMTEDPMMDFSRKNTQDFNYITTDNNGVSTHVSYRVTEPSGPLNNMASTPEKAQLDKLDVTDLNIVPQFSAGTTVIMFNLPSKTIAEVMLKDSKGNVIWSDKALKGSFSKTFPLGLNGIYYLRIKQGDKLAVKKIYKDQM